MKLLFSFALFLVVMSVEGNLRGERSHGRSLKKAKKAKPCMGCKSNVAAVVYSSKYALWWLEVKGRALTVLVATPRRSLFRCSSFVPATYNPGRS